MKFKKLKLLMKEQRKCFLKMGSISSEDAVEIVKMAKDLENYINLVDKTAAGFERRDSNFERKKNDTGGQMLSNSMPCYSGILHEKNPWMWQA